MLRNPRRRMRAAFFLATTALSLTAMAAPALAADPSPSTVCKPSTATFKQVFNRSPWYDVASYVPSPAGNFEGQLTNWTLGSGSKLVSGNETYYVGAATDRSSLSLGSAAVVTSAPICVGVDYPWMRFFFRNTGAGTATLKVEIRGVTPLGIVKSLITNSYTGSSSWKLSPRILLVDNLAAILSTNGMTPVAFRFTPSGGNWQIDDVYVDPYRSR